ncbi:hypothetical protein CKA32_002319 [Geitlerinema sp. FC II]|nr:hypothetical protein CKA32_002319 [Geitlerinema sp. FC II]
MSKGISPVDNSGIKYPVLLMIQEPRQCPQPQLLDISATLIGKSSLRNR